MDEEELARILEDGEFFLRYDDRGARVGFIGRHLEGSMGLLHILPEHRRRGYGAALERFMIRHTLAQGLIPYGQFEVKNAASRALQQALGLRVLPQEIFWLY